MGHYGRTTTETVYVLDNQRCSLLSKRASIELGVVNHIDLVAKTSTPYFRGEFEELFSGLGTTNTSYEITARSDARPVCGYMHPLIPEVKAELENPRANQLVLINSGQAEIQRRCSH